MAEELLATMLGSIGDKIIEEKVFKPLQEMAKDVERKFIDEPLSKVMKLAAYEDSEYRHKLHNTLQDHLMDVDPDSELLDAKHRTPKTQKKRNPKQTPKKNLGPVTDILYHAPNYTKKNYKKKARKKGKTYKKY